MAFRNVALPLLSGGALLLGYAAFAWLRPKRALEPGTPRTLREAGLPEPGASEVGASEANASEANASEANASEVNASQVNVTDPEPFSERSAQVPEVPELELEVELELDFDFDFDFAQALPGESEASLEDSAAPEDIGALFLARATDALSPFGDRFSRAPFDINQLSCEIGALSEASARAAGGENGLEPLEEPEAAAESERRPARSGARS